MIHIPFLYALWLKLLVLFKAKSLWGLLAVIAHGIWVSGLYSLLTLAGTVSLLEILGVPSDIIRDIVSTFRLGSLAAFMTFTATFFWGFARLVTTGSILRAALPYGFTVLGVTLSLLGGPLAIVIFWLTVFTVWGWLFVALLRTAWEGISRTVRFFRKARHAPAV